VAFGTQNRPQHIGSRGFALTTNQPNHNHLVAWVLVFLGRSNRLREVKKVDQRLWNYWLNNFFDCLFHASIIAR
jgi:hypothetical protein